MWLIIALGAATCVFTVLRLDVALINLRFFLLAAATLVFGSRITVQIPHTNDRVSVSDTFILLAMLLFDGELAILLAATDAFSSSLNISKKRFVILFNMAAIACSTFITVWTLRLGFGPISSLTQGSYTPHFIAAICIMAIVQYVAH